MDENRRYSRGAIRREEMAIKLDFSSQVYAKHSYESVRYVTVCAFSIDNFKEPELLNEPVRSAAERAILATAKKSKAVLFGSGYGLISLGGSKQGETDHLIKLIDIEKHVYMAAAPNPISYTYFGSGHNEFPEISFLLGQEKEAVIKCSYIDSLGLVFGVLAAIAYQRMREIDRRLELEGLITWFVPRENDRIISRTDGSVIENNLPISGLVYMV
ncbi:Detected protein of unknown function [Hibiscus syriacus]|uniref:Uncharacterized protein n=1 Tax=Hibiscus syriacus TaxID=106335 RepID=A0A6A2XL20_HIBSY|nr:Detected protein of unknown function [Hibiscus syriacus]